MENKKYTDEEIYENPSMYRDGEGVKLIVAGGVLLIEPSDEYIAKQKALEEMETIKEPTQDDFILDLAFRLAMLEAGF